MAFLGPLEAARVALIRPELREKLSRLMDAAEKELALRTWVSDGYRSEETQAKLYQDAKDPVTGALRWRVSPPGSSRHALGGAFDLHIVGDTGLTDPRYSQLGALGERLGLKWGGRFSRQDALPDPYHFELIESLDEARARWADFRGRLLQGARGGAAVIGALALGVYLLSRRY